MKMIASLLVLALCGFATAGPAEDVRVALALASASRPAEITKSAKSDCGDPACKCGCADGKECVCLKADDSEYAEFLAWKAAKKKRAALAKEWESQGWTLNVEHGYWEKRPAVQQIQYAQPSGGCADGSCGSPSYMPWAAGPNGGYGGRWVTSPSTFYPSFSGGGGCANGSCSSGR